jgi:hypothetical protein
VDTRGFVRNSLDFMHVTLDRRLQLILLFKDIQIVMVELPYELHLNVNIAKLPEYSANSPLPPSFLPCAWIQQTVMQ